MYIFHKKRRVLLPAIGSLTLMMIFIVLYACEKESDRFRTYPRVRDMAVTDISESGARFKASVYALGTEPIIDHGFVWGNYTNPEIGNFDKVYLGATERTGEFTTEILTNLIKDREYYVKPFLITADHIIYGAAVSFVSLGSGAPVISGFEPHIAGWMDTLTIRGNNFSYRNGVNVVKLNDVRCEVIESSDTLLRAVVNYLLSSPKAVLSIDNIGNICTFTQDTFRLIPPVVTDFYPKKARWGDTLYIEGKYLKYPLYVPGNSVSLGSFKCSFLGSLNDSIYIVKIPNELDVVNSDLTIAVNGFSLTGNSPFELQSPMPFTFSPVTGTWGNTITLSGSFNTIISSNSVYFDDIKADIIRTNSNQLEIAVPSGLAKIKSQIIYKSDPFTVVSKDTFQLSEPLILSVYPLQGPNQTIVTIKGRFFSGGASVKFGETPANIISSNDSTLIVNAPDLSNGSYLITVQNKFLNSSSNFNFSINNPIITGIEPVMASFNDVVTVSFLNELSSGDEIQAFFGQYPAEILSLSGNILSVKVPVSLDSIPRNIIIRVNSQDVSSADKFTLSPPEITTFSPQYPSSGQDVIIVGNNFNPVSANNKVMWNQYQLTVKSSTKSEIVATLPLNLPRGSFKISVITGGYKRSSPEPLYMSKSYWLKINSPEIQSMSVLWDNYSYVRNYSEAVNGVGYIACRVTGDMHKFDPSGYNWTTLTNPIYPYSPIFTLSVSMSEVACRNIFYIVSGTNNLWAYDEISGVWSMKSYVPADMRNWLGVGFSLNNKIYYGLDFTYPDRTIFMECDPDNSFLWTRKADFPTNIPGALSTSFSIDSKGYILLSDNSLWEYNSISDSWQKKAMFPGTARRKAVSFVIGETAYIGTGLNGSTEFADIWKYDSQEDTWTFLSNLPEERFSAVAFTINGKGYIGFGVHTDESNLFDFYEFDPNYSF